jgi:uncharacterized protein (TIGR03032 family)
MSESQSNSSSEATSNQGDPIACAVSQGFVEWLTTAGGSVAITTYQAGKLVLVSWDGRQTTILPRQFDKPMGLAVDGDRLALATRHQIWLLANAPLLARDFLEDAQGRYDALFLPRASYYTGDLNVHDVAFASDGLCFVASRFSCLAALSLEHSFVPCWHPKFISEIVPEDRCHLNGLALVNGRPRFVTALGESDTVGGWRPGKADGGILIDVESGEIIHRGLTMPHSPRWYDGHLWFLNSGRGELRVFDPRQGKSNIVCTLPAYLRGLAFVGPYALVGLCQIRERHIFGGLPVQQNFSKLLCGVALIDLRTGKQAGLFEFTSGCQEIYDVLFLPKVHRPMVLNLESEAVREAFPAPQFAYWLRPSSMIPPTTP